MQQFTTGSKSHFLPKYRTDHEEKMKPKFEEMFWSSKRLGPLCLWQCFFFSKYFWAHLSKLIYLNNSKIKVNLRKLIFLLHPNLHPMKKRRIHWYICAAMLCYVVGFSFVLFLYAWWYYIHVDSIERNLRRRALILVPWKRMPQVMSQESEKEGTIWMAWCIDGP